MNEPEKQEPPKFYDLRPRRFRWPTRNGKNDTGRETPFNYGCYFPATDLCITDMGRRGTGEPSWPGLQWLDEATELRAPHGGHLMTMEDFIRDVKSGMFIDYDGFGDYAFADCASNKVVKPSDVAADRLDRSFTHVLWYNR